MVTWHSIIFGQTGEYFPDSFPDTRYTTTIFFSYFPDMSATDLYLMLFCYILKTLH